MWNRLCEMSDMNNKNSPVTSWTQWDGPSVCRRFPSETVNRQPADPHTGRTGTEFILGQTDRIRSRPNVLNSGGETAVECVTERKTSWHHSWLMTPLWPHHFLVINSLWPVLHKQVICQNNPKSCGLILIYLPLRWETLLLHLLFQKSTTFSNISKQKKKSQFKKHKLWLS